MVKLAVQVARGKRGVTHEWYHTNNVGSNSHHRFSARPGALSIVEVKSATNIRNPAHDPYGSQAIIAFHMLHSAHPCGEAESIEMLKIAFRSVPNYDDHCTVVVVISVRSLKPQHKPMIRIPSAGSDGGQADA